MNALDFPLVYRASRFILAPGNTYWLVRKLRQVCRAAPPGRRILDVGCGPSSLLTHVGAEPFGLDLTYSYMRAYSGSRPCVVASADRIPFAAASFDSVWTTGMLHHVPDSVAKATVAEMVRVCRPGGVVVVIDGVMPRHMLTRPVAYALRRLDRGRFMRTEEQLRVVIDGGNPFPKWAQRFTFTLNGLEALVSVSQLPT